ncbi:MAG TPA: DUF3667 domain-containing protein [Sphingomicrobium sp.]|nr:DUF3667 domain-containing protein [Sphingomicrobium sp.]
MGNFESLGDAVTGGLVGRALEPKAGEPGADGHTHETNCLNCAAELTGPFCSRCGQHAHVHRTMSAFFHDFLHGVLHFEGKIWRTLPLLAWRPGELTRRYIDGQRASFVSPVALFLFCVFLTFAVMGLTGALQGPHSNGKDVQVETLNAKALEQRGVTPRTIDAQMQGVPGFVRDAIGKAKGNPELLFYKLKTNAYKFSWALIPISAPFVWLLFPFSRRFRMYDHIVFVTYSLCFMMLLLVAATVAGLVSSLVEDLAWLVPPLHMYRQLRGTYGVGRWGGIWRAAALSIFAFIAISLFVSLLVTLGAFD